MGKKVIHVFLLMFMVLSVAIGNANAAAIKDVPSKLVKGTIKEKAAPLKNTLVMVSEQGNRKLIPIITDGSGSFKTNLKDGTYTVKGVKGKTTAWYSTNKNFVVKEGKIKGLKEGEVTLSTKELSKKPSAEASNFNGVLKEGSNGLKADLIISKYSEEEEEIYTVSSKSNGSFSASLPDGNYYLFGIQVDNGFYRYQLGFTVEAGKVLVDGELRTSLSINIPVNSITGKAGDSSKPLTEAGIVLERLLSENEYDTEFIQYVVTNNQGEFALRKLPDGKYIIGIDHQTYSAWHATTFEVREGKIYINGVKVSSLQIKVPDINVKGTLSDGKRPVTNAYVNFEGRTAAGEDIWIGFPVDSKGAFQYRFQDGFYAATYVDEQYRGTPVNISFEVHNGKLVQNGQAVSALNIKLPPVTLSGKLVDSGTSFQGAVNIEKSSEDGNYEWYSAQTDDKGVYSLRLTDGSYKVRSAYLFEEDQDVAISATFDIINGKLFVGGKEQALLVLQLPPVSLHAAVKDGDTNVTGGFIAVSTADYSFYTWKSINSDGTFTMRLGDGDYIINEVYLEDGTMSYVNQSFSIVDGKTYVNGQLQSVMEISVPPITLTGTLTESGNPVMGDLNISEMNDADSPIWVQGQTNEEGNFHFRLPDGDYKVNDVNLYDATTFSPGTEFSLKSGQLYVNGVQTEKLTIEVPPVTVSGTVKTGQELVTDGYVSINSYDGTPIASSWIQNGFYQGHLADGQYKIAFVQVFKNDAMYNLDKEFTIDGGKLFVDGEEVSALDLNLQDGGQ